MRGLICLALAAAVWVAGPEAAPLRASLAIFVLIGSLWLTQALPLTVTALLVPVLAVGAGLLDLRAALAPFAHPTIFLFLGGFALATALRQQGLDQALASAVLRAAGGRQGRAMVLLAATTAVLSMWMSNTATAAMMLPLALGLLGNDAPPPDEGRPPSPESLFVLLALAYSASLGGMATLVGSPPNALAAAHAGIGFAQWMLWALPTALLMWLLMMAVLWAVLRPRFGARVDVAPVPVTWTRARVATVAIFGITVVAWMAGAPLARALGVRGDIDAWVALCALIALVAFGGLRWPQIESHTEWGVLLLFGGGLALSEVMQAAGATRFLADHVLGALQGAPLPWVLAGTVLFVVALTELLSNTAATALLLPIFVPAAAALGLAEPQAAMAVALASSCGFMLPVATPPNGIVYATGRVPAAVMMRCGLWLNLACAAALTGVLLVLAR